MKEKTKKVFDNITVDQDRTSDYMDISQMYGFSVHANFTGTPSGNLIIEASVNGDDYVTIDTNAISGAGDYIENFPDMMYKHVRLFFDFTSSTGTVNAWINSKG